MSKGGVLFHILIKDPNTLFYFLQETFSDVNDEAVWKNEWGGESIFSHVSHRSFVFPFSLQKWCL